MGDYEELCVCKQREEARLMVIGYLIGKYAPSEILPQVIFDAEEACDIKNELRIYPKENEDA